MSSLPCEGPDSMGRAHPMTPSKPNHLPETSLYHHFRPRASMWEFQSDDSARSRSSFGSVLAHRPCAGKAPPPAGQTLVEPSEAMRALQGKWKSPQGDMWVPFCYRVQAGKSACVFCVWFVLCPVGSVGRAFRCLSAGGDGAADVSAVDTMDHKDLGFERPAGSCWPHPGSPVPGC